MGIANFEKILRSTKEREKFQKAISKKVDARLDDVEKTREKWHRQKSSEAIYHEGSPENIFDRFGRTGKKNKLSSGTPTARKSEDFETQKRTAAY